MKKYLLTGFLFLMPIVLTLLVVVFLFDLFTDPFTNLMRPVIQSLHLAISDNVAFLLARILSLLFLLVFLVFLGAVIRWVFGKKLLDWANQILDQIPIVKTVYKTSRDLLGAFFSTGGQKAFHYPVSVPFPSSPQRAVGFRAGQVPEKFKAHLKDPMTSVFVPTAPHPLSGFLFLIPDKDINKLSMTNEEALKFLVSCGTMIPPGEKP